MKTTWQPRWVHEGRKPTLFDAPWHSTCGGKGGETYRQDLHLLFAGTSNRHNIAVVVLLTVECLASGDPRNVIKTIASVPDTYHNCTTCIINDRDFDIVARNLILLLIALVNEDIDQAADMMLHIWYSPLIRSNDIEFLVTKIRPLLETVVDKIKDKAPGALLGKTWTFGSRSVRTVLTKEAWSLLLRSL